MEKALGNVRAVKIIALGVVAFIVFAAVSCNPGRPVQMSDLRAAQSRPPAVQPKEIPPAGPVAQPASFQIVQSRDVSIPGRRRTELRVVLTGSAKSMAQVEATLREASWRFSASDAVMVFGYWPGDDTTGPFTAGRYDSGWAPGDPAEFTPGILLAVEPTSKLSQRDRQTRAQETERGKEEMTEPPSWSGFSDGPLGPTALLDRGVSLRAGSKWQGWTVTKVTAYTIALRSPRGTVRTYDRAGREVKPGAKWPVRPATFTPRARTAP